MPTNYAYIEVVTYKEGTHKFKRVIMTVTANGFLLSGIDPDMNLEHSRYIPKVKVKDIYIDGEKKDKYTIKEDDNRQGAGSDA